MGKAVDRASIGSSSGEGFQAKNRISERFGDLGLSVTSLRVTMHGGVVGTLAQTEDGATAFQYANSWVEYGFSLSPLSLPLSSTVFVANPHSFDGLFGIFDDSLPDEWGRLLVDRTLRERGIDPYSIDSLARLAM